MFADIASGEVDTADLFFLAAVILAFVVALLYAILVPKVTRWAPVVLSVAVAFISAGWLVL